MLNISNVGTVWTLKLYIPSGGMKHSEKSTGQSGSHTEAFHVTVDITRCCRIHDVHTLDVPVSQADEPARATSKVSELV